MKTLQECKCCSLQRRVRHREFSPKAWASLVHWEEVDSEVVGQPLCESCYEDLRELLIERSSEVDGALSAKAVQNQTSVDPVLVKPLSQSPLAS